MTGIDETPDALEAPVEAVKRAPLTFIIPTRPNPGEVLRYTLRSIAACEPSASVWLAGSFPDWVNPDTVGHVETVEDGGKFGGIAAAFNAVLAHPDVPDVWIRCDDDTVLFRPLPDPMPLYARVIPIGEFVDSLKEPDPKRYPDHNAYVQGMRSQRRILNEWGYSDESPCFDSHTPMMFDSRVLADMFARLAAEHPAHPVGHFRTLYGNVAGGPWETLPDPKLLRPQQRFQGDELFGSTWPQSWTGRAGQQIRDRYPVMCIMERHGPEVPSRYRHARKYSRPVAADPR